MIVLHRMDSSAAWLHYLLRHQVARPLMDMSNGCDRADEYSHETGSSSVRMDSDTELASELFPSRHLRPLTHSRTSARLDV